MNYYFDAFGWYTQENIEGRVTNIKPENMGETTIEGELRSNFTGTAWVNIPYFTHKDPEPAPEPTFIITRLAFLSRFTDAEAIAIDLASIGATAEAAALRRYLNVMNAANFIDLKDPKTAAGVQALESIEILSEGRATTILNTPAEQSEIPSK